MPKHVRPKNTTKINPKYFKGLSLKQQKILEGLITKQYSTKRELVLAAGYTESVAHTKPQIADHPKIQKALADYIRDGHYDVKIKEMYDKIFALEQQATNFREMAEALKIQLDAAKNIDKVQGNHAATEINKNEIMAFKVDVNTSPKKEDIIEADATDVVDKDDTP